MPYKDPEKRRESVRRYDQSDKGKDAHRNYNNSPEGKEAGRRYNNSGKGKETRQKYASSPEGKEVRKKYNREYNLKHKRDQRGKNLKRLYNMGIDDYNNMLDKQHGRCAMCFETPEVAHANFRKKNFYVDHDHKTGKNRELLCHKCNALLGYADDSILLLQEAIRYLEKHGQNNL